MSESSLVIVGADGTPVGEDPGVPSALGVLPLRDTVPFPRHGDPACGRSGALAAPDRRGARRDRRFVMVASRDPELTEPDPEQLYEVGVIGTIARMMKVPDGTSRLLVQGGQRVRLTRWTQREPYLVATLEEVPDVVHESDELTALVREVQRTFLQIVERVPYLPEELQLAVANIDGPSELSHLIASALRITAEEKQELLEQPDVELRLRRLAGLLARELEVISIGSRIQEEVQSELDKGQREYVLRQQLRAIQEELGEGIAVSGRSTSCVPSSTHCHSRRRCGRRPTASSVDWPRSRGLTRARGGCAATWSGSWRCRGNRPRPNPSISGWPKRSSMAITLAWSR